MRANTHRSCIRSRTKRFVYSWNLVGVREKKSSSDEQNMSSRVACGFHRRHWSYRYCPSIGVTFSTVYYCTCTDMRRHIWCVRVCWCECECMCKFVSVYNIWPYFLHNSQLRIWILQLPEIEFLVFIHAVKSIRIPHTTINYFVCVFFCYSFIHSFILSFVHSSFSLFLSISIWFVSSFFLFPLEKK